MHVFKTVLQLGRERLRIGSAAVAVAITAAALSSATLLYDGGYFLFSVVNNERTDVPQLRLTFGMLQFPLVQASKFIDSFSALRVIYSVPLVVMPLIGLLLCWWVLRKDSPRLMVWPALGILIVDLPGQMHWIATSIRTNQMFWPVLMAILIGLPQRTVPMVGILLMLATLLHPQITAYAMLGAVIACVVAWRQPENRRRLLVMAGVLVFCGFYRASLIQPGYEQQEAGLSNQLSQWRSSVLGMPLVALSATLVIALAVFGLDRTGKFGRASNALKDGIVGKALRVVVPLCLLVIVGSMLVWGTDPSRWRHVIDYRGPSLFHTSLFMVIAAADALLPTTVGRSPESTQLRMRVANAAGVIFAVVILSQVVTYRLELNKVRDAMGASPSACVRTSTIAGFDENPLNFWSTPAASLMMQSRQPTHIVLPDPLCEKAIETGVIPIALYAPDQGVPGLHVDLSLLRERLASEATCRAAFGAGWGEAQHQGADRVRSVAGQGDLTIDLKAPATLTLSGTLQSAPDSSPVRVLVNGQQQDEVPDGTNGFAPLYGTSIQLGPGTNTVSLVDDAGAFSVHNFAVSGVTPNSSCLVTR